MAIRRSAKQIEQDSELARYSRQILFAPMGEEGQRKLMGSRVVLIGCGALGTVLADTLVRAGVGHLRICDRDFIELNNLQRQVLFDEEDVAANLPKAEAAKRKLGRINSTVEVEAVVTDVNYRNIASLCNGADLLLDGTDNFETRLLMNDLAVQTRRPWVYGACVGATGMSMVILPEDGPCLRCVFESAPPPEMNPTCDTAGVLAPVVNRVASHQALEVMKILSGRLDAVDRRLLNFDAWAGRVTHIAMDKAYDEGDCPCCKGKRFEYLDGRLGSSATTLCGRDAVQIFASEGVTVDFSASAEKIKVAVGGEPQFNAFMLKATIEDYELTLFPDGRAIVKGTNSPDQARTVYARYVGA